MISFTLITSTPVVLRNQLIAQNVLKLDAGGNLVGVFEGVEWVEVPNPIVTTLAVGTPADANYVPPVMDTRRCYLVKVVRAAESDQLSGFDPTVGDLLHHTKLGNWILNNSTVVTLTSADGRSWPARRVGTNFWGVISPDFGVWQ